MLRVYKHVGETPLQLLERIRHEHADLKDAKLSYAGRLDPMAEGEMIILVDEENMRRADFLSCDKEYHATCLVGVATDTGDCLGRHIATRHYTPTAEELQATFERIKKMTEQTYPWFSGKTVAGVKLFDHFKSGRTHLERPRQLVEIKKIERVEYTHRAPSLLHAYIKSSIGKVVGDFRQDDILFDWGVFFKECEERGIFKLPVFEFSVLVSSGTFIRGFMEEFPFPVVLMKLKRTHIYVGGEPL